MDPATRHAVRSRAKGRCEYCRLPEDALELTFHVEHVIPRQHLGSDDIDNLALACDRCNLNKGPNLSAIDQLTGEIVKLFNPRQDNWENHFRFRLARIEGLTAVGRATARLFQMNATGRVRLRRGIGLVE
ncbi:MAG: HNH endonuclease [Planctomycetia bacterium]|nr:HNH endonuclease [Planctomycetia bacterium]